MRKIVMFNRISLDGYFCGPNDEIDWFIHDPEVDKRAHQMMDPDTILLGRKTYQMFEAFWPDIYKDESASGHLRKISNELNEMKKVVFSETLKSTSWVNSILFNGNLVNEILKLKNGDGKDMVIFGSGSLVRQLSAEKLIDEYLFIVSPVILGSGRSFFENISRITLQLCESAEFNSGHALLHYRKI